MITDLKKMNKAIKDTKKNIKDLKQLSKFTDIDTTESIVKMESDLITMEQIRNKTIDNQYPGIKRSFVIGSVKLRQYRRITFVFASIKDIIEVHQNITYRMRMKPERLWIKPIPYNPTYVIMNR